MKFKLKESSVTVRDEMIKIRELTHAERLYWVKAATEDRFRGPALLVSIGVTEPRVTEDAAGEWPADVVAAVSDAVMALSNMNVKKDKEDSTQKQP